MSILNLENYCIPQGHKLLGQSNKQPLSNLEALTLLAYEKKSVYGSESSLSSNFCSLIFHEIFLIFSDFLYFLSYCLTILKMPSVSGTSSYFC